MTNSVQALTATALKKLMVSGDVTLVDVRDHRLFCRGFVPGSIAIGNTSKNIEFAVNLFNLTEPLVIIGPNGVEETYIQQLTNAGFRNILGFLEDSFEGWQQQGFPIDLIIEVDPGELALDIKFDENLLIIDVRNHVEFAEEHIKTAENLPLINLTDPVNLAIIEDRDNVYVHSGTGYRSVVASSILKKHGFHNIRNVEGGWDTVKHIKGFEMQKDKAPFN